MAKLKKNEDGYDVLMDDRDVIMGTLRRTDATQEPEESEVPDAGQKAAKADASKSKDAETGIAPTEEAEPSPAFDLSDEVGKWEATCSRGGHRLFADTRNVAVDLLERHFVNGHTSGVYVPKS